MERLGQLLYLIFAVLTAMVGYNINHNSLGWAIVDHICSICSYKVAYLPRNKYNYYKTHF